ncbi:RagB/SusD family nutrient uptake outer membrane protein [termite gut metagenome]|uniref:RagB/SusD family nutrient uptake outer membrane protein n=1 Tax=termite gut metagenome TaxID=433724 RepID=A0A5J4RA11_9ZZZZ
MKNIKHILLAVIFGSGLTFNSCSDFMDLAPTTQYTEDLVFSDAALTQSFVNELYNNIQDGAKEHTVDGLTDDAFFTHNYGQKAINEAAISESGLEWYGNGNNPFKWDDRYKGIRYANIIINNIDNVPPKNGFDLNRMKGEAYYLRAHMYHELVRGYGGVPIVTTDYTLNDMEEMKQPRSTVRECLEFIISDLDKAEQNLPATVSDSELGRVTKYVATGLKARILLHIASPLYADRTINTLPFNQFDGDRQATYRAAKEAAVKVINEGPYSLVDCSKGTNTQRAELFKAIITDQKNSEQMFVRNYGIEAGAENSMGKWHGPNGYHNWAGTTPSQDLVMAFEFENGALPQGMTKPGDNQVGNPYIGREPRFYGTVATDGNAWGRPRPADAANLDPTPLGELQAGYYEVTDGDATITLDLPTGTTITTITFRGMYGIDTRKGPIEDWNGSWTGYYERKLIDCSVDAQYYRQAVPWTYMRLAEMYTIAAEASVELGELDDAAKYLDILRGRVGNVDTKTALAAQGKQFNQTDLREFVRHERRVEFAYEGVRYYDVRRWMIADVTNNKPLAGIMVVGRLKSEQTQNKPYIHNEDKYTYSYYVIDLSSKEQRKWDNKLYFAPISRDEMKRNENLVQNPGMNPEQ